MKDNQLNIWFLLESVGLLYLLLKHFVDRYNLFFNYRPPAFKYMDRSVHNTAMYFLIVSTFLLLFCILFYSIIRLGELKIYVFSEQNMLQDSFIFFNNYVSSAGN